jgi:hypothetical protein
VAITVTSTPAAPTAVRDACRIDIAGASENDAAAYDTGVYPTEPELKSYLAFLLGGVEKGRSYVFSVASDGTHSFANYVFPTAGSWTIELRRASNDAVLKSQAITVS